jgi:hypothetical protein
MNRKKSLNLKVNISNENRSLNSPNSSLIQIPEQPKFERKSENFVHKSEQSAITSSLRTNSWMLTSVERFMRNNFLFTKGQNG